MAFYQNYIKKCNEKNVSPTRAAIEAGSSKGAVNRWKNGSNPSDATVEKLAKYLECSFDDLKQAEKERPVPQTENGLSDDAMEAAALFDRAEPWVREQVLSLLRAAESAREAPGDASTDK